MSDQPGVDTSAPLVVDSLRTHTAGWHEVWQYRELLYFLVWRDLKVRYKQTLLGAAWAVIQPFATMVVFSIFFGTLASMPSDGVPYPVFAYAGLVPWTYFAAAVTAGAASLVGSQHLISKVYFPRLLVPLAAVTTPLADAAIAFGLVGVIMAWFGVAPSVAIVALPMFAVLAVATALGAALWFAALNVEFRDVRYVLPFVIQFGLFVTPVAYPGSLVPPAWRAVYSLNPMATVVEGFRWSLAGTPAPPLETVAASVLSAAVLVTSGLWHFARTERTFADLI